MFHSTSARKPNKIGGQPPIKYLTFFRESKEGYYGLKIPHKIAKEAGFIRGDRVDILIDHDAKKVAISRVNEGGWKLGAAGGSTRTFQTKYASFPGCIVVSPEKRNAIISRYKIEDIGIVFDMPPSLIIK